MIIVINWYFEGCGRVIKYIIDFYENDLQNNFLINEGQIKI